jgi:predicted aldo/keto reductase-like oxidoreductase
MLPLNYVAVPALTALKTDGQLKVAGVSTHMSLVIVRKYCLMSYSFGAFPLLKYPALSFINISLL